MERLSNMTTDRLDRAEREILIPTVSDEELEAAAGGVSACDTTTQLGGKPSICNLTGLSADVAC